MVAVPTIDEEDAKRPSRARESLVGERTRIINRMKAALARFGVRGFKPELRNASARLETLRTPEDVSLPPNTLAEIRRDLTRLTVIREQIKAIEQARMEAIRQAPNKPAHAMVRLLACVVGVGIESADMLVREVLLRDFRDRRAVARSHPARVAISHLPEKQCAGPMVRGTHVRYQRRTQDDDDRRAGPKTADRSLAPRNHWRRA
jgi:transposase